MLTSLFPLTGALTSLLDTTPAQRKEKGMKPVAILASFIIPINLLKMIKLKPITNTPSFTTYIGLSFFVTGTQWCIGRQFGHIVGNVLDKYNVEGLR
jgi:hypothetical protein